MKLDDSTFAKLREATRLLQTGGPMAATEAIQRALGGKPAPGADAPEPTTLRDINPPHDANAGGAAATDLLQRLRAKMAGGWRHASAMQPVQDVEEATIDAAAPGQFLTRSCTNAAGTRAYKLYVPSGYRGEALPLVVMLHGCKQNPDDFAAGTGMNAIAEEHNVFVAYPGQIQSANGSNCWNWFQPKDQARGGEPSIIADITREVMRDYRVDERRVYVAGLSAGGAMAAIMGAAYPELYAAIGVHSGLPQGAAHDMPSAFGAMKNGMAGNVMGGGRKATPVIVFHGDRDTTVHPRNGEQVLAQSIAGRAGEVDVEKGTSSNGRSYTVSRRKNASGETIAEHWTVHAAGHAWAGGRRSGSYTDPKGPDASKEMMRFFLTQVRPAQ